VLLSVLENVVKKALEMVDAKQEMHQEEVADYLYKGAVYRDNLLPAALQNGIKGVGFKMPYMEVSGACAGCGETPYYRLLTQLFGNDMIVANATGCSSIYCGSTPGTPFVTDYKGEGVAWANSLFEDNAEFGFGMRLATDYKLALIANILTTHKEEAEPRLKELITEYLNTIKDRAHSKTIVPKLLELLEKSKSKGLKEALAYRDDFVDKSQWIIGGDGWA